MLDVVIEQRLVHEAVREEEAQPRIHHREIDVLAFAVRSRWNSAAVTA